MLVTSGDTWSGHHIGFTMQRIQNQKNFQIFDPNVGEISFSTFSNAKQFLRNLIALYFTEIKPFCSPDLNVYKRVDIYTYEIPQMKLEFKSKVKPASSG